MNLLEKQPTEIIQTLNALKKREKAAQKRRDEFFEMYDRLYAFEHYGKKESPLRSGTDDTGPRIQCNDATNVVDIMVNLLADEEIDITAYPLSADFRGLRDTSEVERWLWGILQASEAHYEGLADAVRLGWGVLYTYWDNEKAVMGMPEMEMPMMMPQIEMGVPPEMMMGGPGMGMAPEMMPQEEIMDFKGCPIVIKALSPYTVFPALGGPKGDWRYVLIIESKPVLDIEDEYGVEIPGYENKAPQQKLTAKSVEVIDYWGWEKYGDEWIVVNAVMCKDKLLKGPELMTGYEDLPFEIFFCREGPKVIKGENRWEYAGLSSLFPVHKSIMLKDELRNARMRQILRYTNLPMIHRKPTVGEGTSLTWENDMIEIVDVQQDEKYEFPEWRGNPPDVQQIEAMLMAEIQAGSFSTLQLGEQIPISGAAARVFQSANLTRLEMPRKNFAKALKGVLDRARSYAANFAPEVGISLFARYKKQSGMVSLAGMDLEPFEIDVALSGEPASDRYRRMGMGIALLQLGDHCPYSIADILEKFFDEDQPDEILEHLWEDMAMRNKAVQALNLQAIIEEETGQRIPLMVLMEKPEAFRHFLPTPGEIAPGEEGGRGQVMAEGVQRGGTAPAA